MKLASGAELIVWAIIAIVVAISKGLNKLSPPSPGETGPNDEAPVPPPVPIRRPRTAAVRRPQSVERRSFPPVVRPDFTENQPPAPPRDFRELLARLKQPAPVPPRIEQIATPVPPPEPAAPKEAKAAATSPPTAAKVAGVGKSSPWAAALRDRSNVRNIIIAAEIIGPPRGA